MEYCNDRKIRKGDGMSFLDLFIRNNKLEADVPDTNVGNNVRFLSLFSGIGAFEKSLDNLGIPYELVGFSEIDKYAVKSYCAVHGVEESMNLGDITKVDVDKLPKDIDLITYGFPCQDISLAGKQKGLFNEDESLTRSGLFFEALRIIEATKPRIAIAENVKNLTSKTFAEQFKIVLDSLEEAGYNNYWQVLNAKDYGIPQNRERVFIISIRKDIDDGKFTFPEPVPLELRLKDMLEDEVDEKYYIDTEKINQFVKNNPQIDITKPVLGTCHERNDLSFATRDRVYNTGMESPTLTATMYKDPPKIMTAGRINSSQDGVVVDPNGIAPTHTAGHGNTPKIIQVGQMYGTEKEPNPQAGRIYSADGISPTMDTCSGGNRMPKIVEPTIQRVDIPQTVTVRKYPVDCKALCQCLRKHKADCGISNKIIADAMDVPLTKVEHWFRQDDCFAIPDAELWMELKALLKIETDEFDESIMTFEEKQGVYEKSERHYFADGLAPTLTSTTAAEKIIVREATKKGYAEAVEGDSINLEQPNSKTRRGRVGKQVAQTLTTSPQQGVVVDE